MSEQLHVFRFTIGAPHPVADLSDFTQDGVASLAGVEVVLKQRHYQKLPGLFTEIQTFESREAGDRFIIKIKHDTATYIFLAQDWHQYGTTIAFVLQNYSILPELLFPEPAGFQSNLQTYRIPTFNGRRMVY